MAVFLNFQEIQNFRKSTKISSCFDIPIFIAVDFTKKSYFYRPKRDP